MLCGALSIFYKKVGYHSVMGLDRFPRPVFEKDVARGAKETGEAPQGWKTINTIWKDLDIQPHVTRDIVSSYRDSNPEYFKIFPARKGGLKEHLSPELIKKVEEEYAKREVAPDGWKTINTIAKDLGARSPYVIKEIADKYRTSNPEYFKSFSAAKGGPREHLSPALITLIEKQAKQREAAPDGWVTLHGLQVDLHAGVSYKRISTIAEGYRKDHPEWFKDYATERGPVREHISKDLADIIKQSFSGEETAPDGWLTISALHGELGVPYPTVAGIAEQYRATNPTWFHVYKPKAGAVTEHLAPELVDKIKVALEGREFAPEGWLTRTALATKLGTSHSTISAIADPYLSSHAEWFKKYRVANSKGTLQEHLSPELIAKIEDEYAKREDAPQGWLTSGALAEKLNTTISTVQNRAERYRKENPEWFKNYNTPRVPNREHYAPQLVKNIEDLLKVELRPEGWTTKRVLANDLKTTSQIVERISAQYRSSNPEWFKEYKTIQGVVLEHWAPELSKRVTEEFQAHRHEREVTRESNENGERLQQESEAFIQEVSEGKTLEAQEFRKLITLFGSVHTADILYKYRPQFEGVSPDYIKGTLAKYLGDFLILNTSFRVRDLEAALPYLSDRTFQDSLFEVVKEGCLSHYHEQKLAHAEVDDKVIIDGYLTEIRQNIASFNSAEMNDVVNRIDSYYLSILQDFKKPDNVVEFLKGDRPFPDLNQTLNIKEIQEKKKMLIGDEMGMGKSASAILAKEYLGSKCALVAVPSNVIETWQRYLSDQVSETGEQVGYFKKGMAPRVLTVENPMFLKALDVSQYDYILISQEKLNKRYVKELETIDYDMLIIDEVHKLKNLQKGERSQYTLDLAGQIDENKKLVLLSGTPVPNKIHDVAMVLKLLYPERFGSKNISEDDLVDSIIRGDIVDIRNLLVPRMQMKTLRESIKMPQLTEELLTTALTKKERDIYEILLEDDELTADQKIRAFRKFVMNPSALDVTPNIEGSKIHDVREHLQQVFREKDKVVFFVNSYVEGMIRGENTILDKLDLPSDIAVRVIEGQVSKEERSAIQHELDETQGKMLLAVSGGTADVGVDFSSADHVEMYNEPWTKFDKSQQIARVYRPGLENDLTVSTWRTEGTIEQGIGEYIELKYNAIQKLLKGVPTTKIEQDILRSAEKLRTPDIEGDITIAKEFLNSPQNRLHKFYAITKGGGEEHFRKFLLEHGDEYAESYFDMGTRGFQANTARVVGTLIDRFIAEKGSPENLTILDIASGPEMLKTHIDDSYKPNVVSLDLNPRFFEGEGENRIIGSMVSLPVREKSVDYANISLALHYSEFKPRRREYQQLEILSEMNRVLKVGGRGTINLLYSQQFKDTDMFKKVVEGTGFRLVPEYTGIASAPPYFQSYCVVLEKVADAEVDIDKLVAQIGKENLDGFKLKDTSVSLKNSRRTVSEFSINDQNVPVSFNTEDRGLLQEERSILNEGESLQKRYGSIREIPKEEIINRNFLKIYNGKNYRLLKKSEKIGGFVDVR
jgi:SWI/SNF-related matrix-associated actin-dependent regulator 1 of chromatin subfamily A